MKMRVQMRQMRSNEQGMVSLFTCILISLLLLVVTTSMVSLEALQLRKAADAEQTIRAYYTAEAGVEDAVSKVLRRAVTSDQTCTNKTDYDIPGAAGWTCQQITFSGTPFGKLDTAEIVKTVDPGPSTYRSVVVQWNQVADPKPAQFYNMSGAFGGTLPSQAAGTGYAAPVELSIVEYPTGGFRASDVGTLVKLQNVLIVPAGSGGGAAAINYSSPTFKTGSPYPGNCSALPHTVGGGVGTGTSNTYNCHATITNLDPSKAYMFRIRSKYTASAFQMVFKSAANGTGSVVTVPDGMATIDVTARAGQTYRRVISKLPINNSAAGGLNYVMYSDGNICKNFSVFDNVAQSPPGC